MPFKLCPANKASTCKMIYRTLNNNAPEKGRYCQPVKKNGVGSEPQPP